MASKIFLTENFPCLTYSWMFNTCTALPHNGSFRVVFFHVSIGFMVSQYKQAAFPFSFSQTFIVQPFPTRSRKTFKWLEFGCERMMSAQRGGRASKSTTFTQNAPMRWSPVTSTKTLIIFAHNPAEAVKTHQCYFSGNERKKNTAQLIVPRVVPFKETV